MGKEERRRERKKGKKKKVVVWAGGARAAGGRANRPQLLDPPPPPLKVPLTRRFPRAAIAGGEGEREGVPRSVGGRMNLKSPRKPSALGVRSSIRRLGDMDPAAQRSGIGDWRRFRTGGRKSQSHLASERARVAMGRQISRSGAFTSCFLDCLHLAVCGGIFLNAVAAPRRARAVRRKWQN